MEKNNLRNVILNMLLSTLEKGKLSHLVLKEILEDGSLDSKEKAYINRTFSGTLEKLVYLDFAINSFSSVPVKKMKPVIRNILRMSFYQMRFMDSVPVYTCIDEAVKLTRKRGLFNLAGFVNAVLRNLDRNCDTLNLPDYVVHCVPEWIYSLIISQYGRETAVRFFEQIKKEREELTVRFNEFSYQKEEILKALEKDSCTVRMLESSWGCYGLSGFEDLSSLIAFKKGMIIMQDPSSVLAMQAAVKDLQDPKLILDVCAAPGGKSMYLAQCFPSAAVIARDLSEQKIGLIQDNIRRTGICTITPQVYDALIPDPEMKEKADLVIADLPCSGLGVIARKPDILYRLKPEDMTSLAQLQRSILKVVKEYVKPGGILLFSTCTVDQEENQENTRWFLGDTSFVLADERQFMPGKDPFDGFYYAEFRKKEKSE